MRQDELVGIIRERRSIRAYTGRDIPDDIIEIVLEAGRWAPSGLNNQPWKFSVIRSPDTKGRLAELTSYERIVRDCNICIVVFYDVREGYHRDKDFMAIGACVQNMLLAAHVSGVGAVWLGEILNRKGDVNNLLGCDATLELAAVVALGYPAEEPRSTRKPLESLLFKP